MPQQIASTVTVISILLAFFDVILWGTVGWVIVGCVVYLVLMAISNHMERSKSE